MKRLSFVLIGVILASCAHLPGGRSPEVTSRTELWHEAHMALYQETYPRADSLFVRLAAEHPESTEGREALFYVGSIHLDPRNRNWNPERAETALRQYLLQDTLGTRIHRRPEANILLELARQLNLPPEDRVAGLAGEPSPATVPATPPAAQRVVAPTAQLRELQTENERLRQQVAQRDEQLRRQREELDRIRRTLTPRTP
jgi:TolA-binding protein